MVSLLLVLWLLLKTNANHHHHHSTSRYPNNDTCLVMEKVIQDLGACVNHMRTKFKYEKIVLAGWSGGGSLSSFYQGQAELPVSQRISRTPAGDAVNLSSLTPADGLLILAAHSSRARIFTEWIDPAVLDENDPSVRDYTLDLWDPRNPNQAPYTREYVARYRRAQVERNDRITRWVEAKLRETEHRLASNADAENWRRAKRDDTFSVRCTQADIRRVDVSIDPNEREPTPLKELAAENHSPVGLARFTTLRAWLSQWSLSRSNADGPRWLRGVSVQFRLFVYIYMWARLDEGGGELTTLGRGFFFYTTTSSGALPRPGDGQRKGPSRPPDPPPIHV